MSDGESFEARVTRLFGTLTPRELAVLRKRLPEGPEEWSGWLARCWSETVARIREIERKARTRLR